MARHLLVGLLVVGLTGCPAPPAPDGAESVAAAISSVEASEGPVPPPPATLVPTSAPTPAPAPAEPEACIPERAIALIIAFEIGDPATYERHYQAPVWPGGQSGATIGIGYDLGYQAPHVIVADWHAHGARDRLAQASGVKGKMAKAVAEGLADVRVPWPMARDVFDATSLVEHCRMARRAFPGLDDLSPNARGAVVSVVFNRGAAMAGERRREMREIRDTCVPARDAACVARNIRAMTRIWVGTDIAAGMAKRREAEAVLAEAA